MLGLSRIAIGCAKKWAADNLSGWIVFIEPHFSEQALSVRWLFVVALAFRILLDFSGYSDMAIGFARMMGIVSWIRDYVYIPLGGSRRGLTRRVSNALLAMLLCGLWHGAAWNFAVWGVYHGLGLALTSLAQTVAPSFMRFATGLRYVPQSVGAAASGLPPTQIASARCVYAVGNVIAWAATMLFVGIGWLLFFYPTDRALTMAVQLFR
jgi:alginate O-acetyltransferase complex protein AlgI